MANILITALPAASSLAGTEAVPLDQSGVTKRATVALMAPVRSVNAATGDVVLNAAAIANTPAGSIAATTVQAALDELASEKQPLDAELTALAGLTSAADKAPYFTGSGTAALATLTAFARTVLDDADAATARATLGAAASASPTLTGTATLDSATLTGTATLAAGSAISPSLTFTGDTNTGLYAVAADQVGITAGGGLVATFKAAGPDLASGKVLSINAVQVVGPRATGWAAATGTATRTTFVTSTVTLEELAQRVKALLDDLIVHGLIGT